MPFINLSNLEEREIAPGYRAKFVHTQRMTAAYWDVDQGAALPEHSHPHEQIANVIAGRFELTVDGESKTLEPGQVAVIPPHTPHSGKALTPCQLLDIFSPPREDYQ